MENKNQDANTSLFDALREKAQLKQLVYRNTLVTFNLFRDAARALAADYHSKFNDDEVQIPFEFVDKGEFEFEIRFAGDILIFMMHTNVFEFPRDHDVMKIPYIREDKTLSYCGVINIYNFLADSFKYNRYNDLGYMIGRVFINKGMHYFIEGKRELGMLFNNFGRAEMDAGAAQEVLDSAIRYTFNFDLLTPPYDQVKLISVRDINSSLENMRMITGKRLGFRFQADNNGELGG